MDKKTLFAMLDTRIGGRSKTMPVVQQLEIARAELLRFMGHGIVSKEFAREAWADYCKEKQGVI